MDRCTKDEPTAKNLVCKKAFPIPEKNWKNLFGGRWMPWPSRSLLFTCVLIVFIRVHWSSTRIDSCSTCVHSYSTCVHSCSTRALLVFTRIHSCSTCVHSYSTCVHSYSLVFTRIHSCSTRVHSYSLVFY